MEDREGPTDGAKTCTEHHVADLAHGGGREHLLHIVLRAADDCAEEQRDRADDDDRGRSNGRSLEDCTRANDEVDTGGDHRCRVDESGHGSRASHCIAEPRLQRELSGLTARTH